ncbi:DUF3466 family protein [Glaciecola sp. SC05]|uniref:DUF3466 family protein n=1 Tax=Glaciecola sp. SC05 TaxID=1987355 RepID=UPI0035297ADF
MKLNQWIGVIALSSAPIVVHATAYDVQELPVTELSGSQFGSSIDNSGLILTTLINPFSPPIDMTLFDVANFPLLTDPDAAAQGEFNNNDYAQIVNTYRQNAVSFSTFGQKLANQVIYQTDGTDAQYVFGFDEEQTNTDGFTFGMNTRVAGSANGAYIVGNGSSLFTARDVMSSDGTEFTIVIADVLNRGFVQFDGQVNPLLPLDMTLEGFSSASAINENLQVAGVSSVGVRDLITSGIENCASDDLTIPVEACIYELKTRSQEQFVRRATVWQLDAQGQVVSTTAYDLDFTLDEDELRNFTNEAVAINNSGVAVGTGTVLFNNQGVTAAMVFENGTTRRLLDDDSLLPNFATSINDQGIVVGYQIQAINGQGRAKFFTYDLNTETLTFPDDFFASSSTFPRDINSDGIVVGDAEIDASQSQRRRGGFVYNPQTDEFIDLNTLIPCDTPYSIVAANSINDSGVIVADAAVLRSAKNVRGQPFLDADGNEILETAVVALKLTPNGADAPDCSVDGEEDPNEVRQGASNSMIFILFLTGLALFRRIKR